MKKAGLLLMPAFLIIAACSDSGLTGSGSTPPTTAKETVPLTLVALPGGPGVAPFSISACEITCGQFAEAVTYGLSAGYDSLILRSDSLIFQGIRVAVPDSAFFIATGDTLLTAKEAAKNQPMTMISWYGAVLFCNLLSLEKGLSPCYTLGSFAAQDTTGILFLLDTSKNGYRLPLEAEWEYAARGGRPADSSLYPSGNSISPYDANFNSHHAADVGSFRANPFGLYDMAGNVWEWCTNEYGTGPDKAIRGGSYEDGEQQLRCDFRSYAAPGVMDTLIGFRIAIRK